MRSSIAPNQIVDTNLKKVSYYVTFFVIPHIKEPLYFVEIFGKMRQKECILLIDDDKITNILHEELVRNLSLFRRIEIARDGAEALEKISKLSMEGIYPSLILLDINMGGMNGFEFLEAYHYLKPIVKCPVIMVSTSALYMDKEKAEIFGVDGYYTKPLTKDKLKRIIDKYLS